MKQILAALFGAMIISSTVIAQTTPNAAVDQNSDGSLNQLQTVETGTFATTTVVHDESTDMSTHNTNVEGSNTVTHAADLSKQVAPHTTSNLTTSGNDTCFGSATGGVSLPGVGISGGSTYVDENCVMLKRVKLLNSLGLKDAAIVYLANSDEALLEAIALAHPELFAHLFNEERVRSVLER